MNNTSCILTVIKNEHEYLDEWIKYHIDLGIDHIFIFEDIDSDSHKSICDKYGEKVSLNSVLRALDKKERERAKEIKELKIYNVQNFYFKKLIRFIKNFYTYKYDWCFLIDNDEFITLENENDKINDVLNLYKDYDAFIMSWKCYGANGYVNKPDYSKKGVVETYTKEVKPLTQDYVKSCYKIRTFDEDFLVVHHYPTDVCNWCNTDFVKNRFILTYNKIYLRHYITKSWEEYIWKLTKRRFMWGLRRDYDFFFRLNKDMEQKRKELMDNLNKEKLVVMPYVQKKAQGNEIKFVINGWKKFCQFKYRFVVIGEFDEKLKNEFPWVEFIKCPSVKEKEGQYMPHLDIQNKFKVASKLYGQEYDGFIYTCDDYYPIKPFEFEDIEKIHHHSMSFVGTEKAPTSYWSHDKWKTRQLLDKHNLPHINYTTHYPSYFEFKKFYEIWKKFDMFNNSYEFDDVYYNYFEHEEPILDSEIRLGIWNKEILDNDFKNAVENPNIKFMCNSVEGWSKELENKLAKII